MWTFVPVGFVASVIGWLYGSYVDMVGFGHGAVWGQEGHPTYPPALAHLSQAASPPTQTAGHNFIVGGATDCNSFIASKDQLKGGDHGRCAP